MSVEAEDAEAIVEVDEDDALLGQILAVVVRRVATAFRVGAAEDPDHDWPTLVGAVRLCPDVQVQTVLAHLRRIWQVDGHVDRLAVRLVRLHAWAGEGFRVANAFPLRN